MRSRRGFTLIELMITVGIASIVVAAVGALYLEFRIDASSQESRVLMTRRASLVLEQVTRDVAGADSVEQRPDGVHVRRGDDVLIWRVEPRGLVRAAGGDLKLMAPRATELQIVEEGAGHLARLVMRRKLIGRREVRIVRGAFIGRRK